METKYIEKVKEINKEKNLKYYILTMGWDDWTRKYTNRDKTK